MLLLAIAAAVVVTGIRWTRRGGDWDLVFRVAVWGVAAGIVGARLYHVVTSWDQVPDPKWRGVFEVWEGGLGVWGGIFFGALAGAIVVRRSGHSVLEFMDVVAPGLLLAQAVGRWGNWWNQELFGKPTDAAWGLEIDLERRPDEYISDPTFHPTFLYESIYCLIGVGLLLLVERRFRIRPPGLFALYVALLHRRALLPRAAARRPVARAPRAAPERVGVRGRLRRRRPRSSSGGSSCARATTRRRRHRTRNGRAAPKMAIPGRRPRPSR